MSLASAGQSQCSSPWRRSPPDVHVTVTVGDRAPRLVGRGDLETIKALDNFYGTRHLKKLWRLAKRESVRPKYAPFMEREEKAATRYEYAAATVPGLLQTEEYAREQIGTDVA